MALTPDEKAARARNRMLDTSRQYTLGTYSRKFVAPIFQKMIRAEWAAQPTGSVISIVDGKIEIVFRRRGQCVCVTCGKVQAWSGGLGGMHTGHFLGSRRLSILYDEDNVAPQCSHCNRFSNGSPQAFRMWMVHVRGYEIIERLRKLKDSSVTMTREELVDKRIEYAARLKQAQNIMRMS